MALSKTTGKGGYGVTEGPSEDQKYGGASALLYGGPSVKKYGGPSVKKVWRPLPKTTLFLHNQDTARGMGPLAHGHTAAPLALGWHTASPGTAPVSTGLFT